MFVHWLHGNRPPPLLLLQKMAPFNRKRKAQQRHFRFPSQAISRSQAYLVRSLRTRRGDYTLRKNILPGWTKQHTSRGETCSNGFRRFSSVKAPFVFHFRKDDHYRSSYENGLHAWNNESSSPVRGTIDKNEASFASRVSHMAWIWLIVRALCRNLAFVRCGIRSHIVIRVAGDDLRSRSKRVSFTWCCDASPVKKMVS